MTNRFALVALLVSTIAVAPASSQEHAHPQGDEKLGTLHFQNSCSPAVAARFDRGMALLHSFEFGAAIQAFNGVLAADSTCAMAHWGIAMSQWSNPMAAGLRLPQQLQRGMAAIERAERVGAGATERERGYVAAAKTLFADHERLNQPTRIASYVRAMGDLAARFPADTEAKIFHAVALVGAASPTDKTYADQLRAGDTLEALWRVQPNHPGLAHYIIHAYDFPALANRAKAAAERYVEIAPSAAHALHMPSHTFTRVGMWEQSVRTNLRSMEAAVTSNAIGEALHAIDYAVYANLQLGRNAAARSLLDRMTALAPKFDPTAITGAAPPAAGFFALAATPARYALERGDWRAAAMLKTSTTPTPWADAITHFARALGAARTGALDVARTSIDSLGAIQQRLAPREAYWAEQVAIQKLGAEAWLARAEKRNDAALTLMSQAAQREDATEKSAVTPGPLAPARELLGDLLMEMGRPADALREYRAVLQKEPGRRRAIAGERQASQQASRSS